jgi:hypothetical protein
MTNVTILYVPGHERITEKAIEKIEDSSFDAVFVGLPEDLETTVEDYIDGGIPEETVWKEYEIVTGLHKRFAEPVRCRIQPLLRHLTRRKLVEPETRVFCYQDLSSHVETGRAAERVLLLLVAERVRRQVQVEEWRNALLEELESTKTSWERSLENLVEKAVRQDRNIVMHTGLISPLRDRLVDQDLSVTLLSCGEYWRSPIEVLRILLWLKGSDGVSDEEIQHCVQEQMRYLDFVLSSESLDIAHERWASRRAWT